MLTIATIWAFFKRFVWFPLVDHWRIVLPIVAVIVLIVFVHRACSHVNEPKIDERVVHDAQVAIATQDRKDLERVFVDASVAEKQIDANVATGQADKYAAIQNAREKAHAMTNEEITAYLEGQVGK